MPGHPKRCFSNDHDNYSVQAGVTAGLFAARSSSRLRPEHLRLSLLAPVASQIGRHRRRPRIPQGWPLPVIRHARSRRLGTKQNRPARAVNRRIVSRLMTTPQSAKPATDATVNGLQEADRLERQINFTANPTFRITQDGHRVWTIRAHWVVVRQNNGWRRSIPIFIRRAVPITRSGSRQ
jgi:hypothetical protein